MLRPFDEELCPECEGSGIDLDNEECSWCGGEGWLLVEDEV